MRQPPPLSESVLEAIGNAPTIPSRLLVVILAFLLAFPTDTKAADFDETVRTARQYLACSDQEQRAALSQKLAEFTGDWRDVVKALRPRPTQAVKPGYYREEHFTDPQLRQKHPDDLLYLVVPTGYQPDQPTGLVVFMHGGGKGSPRTAPDRYMTPADSTTPRSSTRLGDMFEALGMIGVGPSAPWNENDHSRWCLPEADDYIADVVQECATRFHIDLDRVFLLGHSMGGFGAYHQVQRQPDRFAAVIASAGSWSLAQWPVIRGTTFCIVHGAKDAELGVRDRHTDIAFARYAHELLSQRNIPHVYKEHPDGHSFGYGKAMRCRFPEGQPQPASGSVLSPRCARLARRLRIGKVLSRASQSVDHPRRGKRGAAGIRRPTNTRPRAQQRQLARRMEAMEADPHEREAKRRHDRGDQPGRKPTEGHRDERVAFYPLAASGNGRFREADPGNRQRRASF